MPAPCGPHLLMTISKMARLIGTFRLEGASNAPSEARPSVLPMPPHLFSFPSGERRVACRSKLPFRAAFLFCPTVQSG